MTKKWNFIILIITVCILSVIFLYLVNSLKIKSELGIKDIELDGINKVMIVAHPDDDIIWGGGHLLEDNYLVVCVTCGSSDIRVLEFKKAMSKTGDKYLMLGYPDRTKGERDNWKTVKPSVIADIEQVINMKNWELIVTHNPDGEYGHIHHKLINEIVRFFADKKKLYYFGKYYSKKQMIDNEGDMIDSALLQKKLEIIDIYRSQSFIKTRFDHMFPYENWIPSEKWKEVRN